MIEAKNREMPRACYMCWLVVGRKRNEDGVLGLMYMLHSWRCVCYVCFDSSHMDITEMGKCVRMIAGENREMALKSSATHR